MTSIRRYSHLGPPASDVGHEADEAHLVTHRLVKKLALRGRTYAWGARYDLYLRVTVPKSTTAQVFPLLPDHDVKLLSSSVDPLTPSGGYLPLSESAARAAHVLGGLHLSTESDGKWSEQEFAFDTRVTVSDYAIALALQPKRRQPGHSTTAPSDGMAGSSYLVTLSLETHLTSKPPRAPYILHLPVPRCLHSRVRLTFSPEVINPDREVDVRVEPPLGSRRNSRMRRADSSQQAESWIDDDTRSTVSSHDDGIDEGDEGLLCVHGLFPATDRLSIRWSDAGAGKLSEKDDVAATFCDVAQLNMASRYSLHDDNVRLDVVLRGNLLSPFCPGPDHITYFPLGIQNFGQQVECHDISIEETTGLRSWHLLPQGTSDRPSSGQTTGSEADSLALVDDTASEDDLLATKLPAGLESSMDLSTSLNGLTCPTPSSSARDPRLAVEQQKVILYLDSDSFSAEDASFSFVLRCAFIMPIRRQKRMMLPAFLASTAEKQRISYHIESHEEVLAPLQSDLILRPSYDADADIKLNAPSQLSFETSFTPSNQQFLLDPFCYLHIVSPNQDMPTEDEDSTKGAFNDLTLNGDASMSREPPSSQGIHRPMPVYDTIVLQGDSATSPVKITSVSLTFWAIPDKSYRRLMGELRFSWPVTASAAVEDEVDVWLPRLEGADDPKVRHVEVQGRLVEPAQRDAGESICLHVRRPEEDFRSSLNSVYIVFEYQEQQTDSEPKAMPSHRRLPIPLFAHDVVKCQVSLSGFLADVEAESLRALLKSDADVVTRISESTVELIKFDAPTLTALEVLVPSPFGAVATNRRRRLMQQPSFRYLGRISALMAGLVLLLAILFASLQQRDIELDLLHRRVETLAMAANVDFRDGSWTGQMNDEGAVLRHPPITSLALDAPAPPAEEEEEEEEEKESQGKEAFLERPDSYSPTEGKASPQNSLLSPTFASATSAAFLHRHHVLAVRNALAWPLIAASRHVVSVVNMLLHWAPARG